MWYLTVSHISFSCTVSEMINSKVISGQSVMVYKENEELHSYSQWNESSQMMSEAEF